MCSWMNLEFQFSSAVELKSAEGQPVAVIVGAPHAHIGRVDSCDSNIVDSASIPFSTLGLR